MNFTFSLLNKLIFIKNSFKSFLYIIIFLSLSNCASTSNTLDWNATVKKVSSGVVSIHTDVPVSFDGKWNSSSFATGFIVDADLGIILTNRHVVTPGPVTAKAILINNEEIELTPLYFDPVHDFGFYQYSPEDIQHLTPHEFTLNPDDAHVGQDIRIIGNDAGQKISILDGTISRLDRAAPNYGKGKYNDFNTYYIQAATASTGGSSGSPVINIKGEAVALNAGSQSRSANAFYFPLTVVKKALNNIQQKQKNVRGTIQTTFKVKPYAELTRLGLTNELEKKLRKSSPDLKGLLVIDAIVPETSAAKSLAVGDILLSVNNTKISNFLILENLLNQQVSQEIMVEVLRRGEVQQYAVMVDDLFSITPNAYLKFDSSIFHNLSYQQARHFNKPIKGVYVAYAGTLLEQAGINNFSVITEFNGIAIENIDQLNEQLKLLPNGSKVHTRFFSLYNPHTTNYGLVEISRKWFEHSYCQLDQALGYWPCKNIEDNSVQKINQPKINNLPYFNEPEHIIASSLVQVSFTSPYSIQGRTADNGKYGTGVIVDKEKGWVVIDRSVVYSILGDVKLTFNNTLEITGKVEYIHPLHNLALVSYSPAELGNIPVNAAKISNTPLVKDMPVVQVGLNYEGIAEYRSTHIDVIQELWLSRFNVPQYVDKNIDLAYLITPNETIDGVLINEQGEVVALWATFEETSADGKGKTAYAGGIAAEYIKELISLANTNNPLYSLDLSLTQLSPIMALQQGLPEKWLIKLFEKNPKNKKLLSIYNISASAHSHQIFKRGDILLMINEQPVTTFRQVEQLSQKTEVTVTFFRQGKVYTEKVSTVALSGQDIEQVLFWSGLYLHAPHRPAQLQRNVNDQGVYIASYSYGSPASRHNIYAMRKIIEVNGQKVTTNQDFINVVKNQKHRDSVLLKMIDFNKNISVKTIKLDNHYWPFYEVKYDNGEWHKQTYDINKQTQH